MCVLDDETLNLENHRTQGDGDCLWREQWWLPSQCEANFFGQWDVFAFCRLLQLKLFKPPSVEIVTSGQYVFLCLEKASASCQPEKELSTTCLIAQVVTEWSNLTWHHCSQPERPNNKGFESVAFRSKFTYFSNTHIIHNIHQFEAKRWDIRCLWDQQIGRGWNVPFRTDRKLL